MKKFIIPVILLLYISFWSAYFEDKYFCKFNTQNIEVSLKKENWFERCLDYYNKIYTQIKQLDKSIKTTDWYLEIDDDKLYRSKVKIELESQRTNLVYLQNILDKSLSEFENNLFIKVKKLLNFYLRVEKDKLEVQYTATKIQIDNHKKSWNIEWFKNTINRFETIQLKRNILQKVFIATDFEELIPLLKVWIDFGRFHKI